MALIKFGGGIIEMRGSIGGTVFSRNSSGNYARAKTTPINPNTARQQNIRATMALLTSRWSQVLTASQRAAWNLYASSVAVLNRLGETTHISGYNHFIRSNIIIRSRGPWTFDDGPTVFEIPDADPTYSIAASETSQEITVSFDDGLEWANEDPGWLLMFMGSPQNPQINFFDGPWRFLSNLVGIEGGGVVQPHVATAPFAISEGQRIWSYARIMRKDGRISEPFRADTFCLA